MLAALLNSLFIFSVALWPLNREAEEVEIQPTQLAMPANLEDFQTLRVSVMRGASEITVATDSAYRVFDGNGQSLLHGDQIVATPVKTNDRGVQFGAQTFRSLPVVILSEGKGIRVDNRVYRDSLLISADDKDLLHVINELPIEDYLRGVLPWEANPKWPIEALKAQAVASRTYAFFRAVERRKERYDVSNSVMSQVYKGQTIESPETDRAIRETEGQILTLNGNVFPAYFHSTCGGQTTQAKNVWPVKDHPSLQGGPCEFCHASKHYRWQVSFSETEILTILSKKGYDIPSIDRLQADSFDRSGRAREFKIESGKKKWTFHSNDFRIWMDPARLKSTKILSIDKIGDQITIRGFGWGHGVGLCQYGMKGLAELGYSYQQILEYYYPGSRLTNMKA